MEAVLCACMCSRKRTICHTLAIGGNSLQEGGLAEVHLHGDRLPRGVGQRQVSRLQEHHRRAVAAERFVREGVDLRIGKRPEGAQPARG